VAARAVYDTVWSRTTRLQVRQKEVAAGTPGGVVSLSIFSVSSLLITHACFTTSSPPPAQTTITQHYQQRDFFIFGGEFLMVQNAENLRGFFDSFFRLPIGMWTVSIRAISLTRKGGMEGGWCKRGGGCSHLTLGHFSLLLSSSPPHLDLSIISYLPLFPLPNFKQGFLAGWPGLPNNDFHETWDKRLIFGIQFWLLSPLSLKIALGVAGVMNGGYPFIRCVTPFAELPLGFEKEAAAEAKAAAGAAAAAAGGDRSGKVEYEGVT